MARGTEAKARRKEARKEARAAEAERLLNGEGATNDFGAMPEEVDADLPGPSSGGPPVEEDSSDDDAAGAAPEETPEVIKKKKKSKSRRSRAAAGGGMAAGASAGPPKSKEGIKTLPLVFLVLLTGTAVLPALLYAGDYLGAFIQRNHIMGNLGHRLGIGPSPKKRVMSFYEKHDPTKLDEVPTILSKYYGDYPKLVKRLERKYGDYGYFLNWESDEAPMNLAMDQLLLTRDFLADKWNLYAPQFAKTGARNVKYNLGTIYKKGRKIWVKQVWPVLQPYIGVPDEKTAKAQKRKDAAAARDARPTKGGRRKKNTEYRDDVEDEM